MKRCLVLALVLFAGACSEKRREPTRLDLRPPDKRASHADPATGLGKAVVDRLPEGTGLTPPSRVQVVQLEPDRIVIASESVMLTGDGAGVAEAVAAKLAALAPEPVMIATRADTPLEALARLSELLGASGRGDLGLAVREPNGRVAVQPFCVRRATDGTCHGDPQWGGTTKHFSLVLAADGSASFATGEPEQPPIALQAINPRSLGTVITNFAPSAEAVIFDLVAKDAAVTVANALPALTIGATPVQPRLRFTLGMPAPAAPPTHVHPDGTPPHEHGPATAPDHAGAKPTTQPAPQPTPPAPQPAPLPPG